MTPFEPGDILGNRLQLHQQLWQTSEVSETWTASAKFPSRPKPIRVLVQIRHLTPVFQQVESKSALLDRAKQLCAIKHPNVPRYLHHFYDEQALYLVQRQPKEAKSLAQIEALSLTEMKAALLAVLQILQDLHRQESPILHLNLRPQTIWLNPDNRPYLVGFGLEETAGISSFALQKNVFLAPEQATDRELSPATDLYNFGLTWICHLTQTSTQKAQRLRNARGELAFQRYLSNTLSAEFSCWLEALVDSDMHQRPATAQVAITELERFSLERLPNAAVTPHTINLKADLQANVIHADIKVRNAVPETSLSGTWRILPTSEDPEPSAWLTLEPLTFRGNDVDFKVAIALQNLRADAVYKRTLCLTTNAINPEATVSLRLRTTLHRFRRPAITKLLWLALMSLGFGAINTFFIGEVMGMGWGFFLLTAGLAKSIGATLVLRLRQYLAILSILIGLVALSLGALAGNPDRLNAGLIGFGLGLLEGLVVGVVLGDIFQQHRRTGFSNVVSFALPGTTVLCFFCLGLHWASEGAFTLLGAIALSSGIVLLGLLGQIFGQAGFKLLHYWSTYEERIAP